MGQTKQTNHTLGKAEAAARARERRRGPRHPARGPVELRLAPPESGVVHAQLVDLGSGGFRAAHKCPWLQSGGRVHFHHALASGTALVVWNRALGNRWESGFLILEEGTPERNGGRQEPAA